MAVLITLAMLSSLVVYATIVEILRSSAAAVRGVENLGVIRVIFFVLGAVHFLTARIFREVMLRKKPGESIEKLLSRLTRASIFTSALCEVPAVLGLVLFIIGGQRGDFYMLGLMSLVMFAVYFPRMSQWNDWLGSAKRGV